MQTTIEVIPEPVVAQVQRLSDSAWYSLAGMITAVVASLTAAFISWNTNRRVINVDSKVDKVSTQAAEIHTLTNSNNAALVAKLDTQIAETKAANAMIVQLRLEKKEADKRAEKS